MSKATLPAVGLLALLASVSSCRKGENTAVKSTAAPSPAISPDLKTNQLATASQGLLATRKNSPVNWQQWDPMVLKHAAESKRLVFVFVGSAQFMGCLEALDAIDGNPALVARLNGELLPVLADPEIARECGVAAGFLANDSRTGMSFPYVMVLSPEGDEISWHGIPYDTEENFLKNFDNATDLITKMWAGDSAFALRNSKEDHARRLTRIPPPDAVADPATRDAFLLRTTRQMISQYDPDVGVMSGTGGLFPLGSLQSLALSAKDPLIPKDLAERCSEAVAAFGKSVLYSGMVDPLDGGVYSSRIGNSWDLPVTQRTCMMQARVARALVSLHATTGDARPLEVALGAVKFAEEQFITADGLFSNQRQPTPSQRKEWMWTIDQIDAALTPQEAALWKALCRLQALGNLPMEADPMRQFFRMNSLGIRIPLAEAAAQAKVEPAQAAALFESGRKKLLEARLARLPQPAPAPAGVAAASFRMVSAYSALYTATGDAAWRDKALALAKRAREAFLKDDLLTELASPDPSTVADARAFTYALAIQAALDLAEVTLDETWRLWAGDMVTVVAEQFSDSSGRLLEARPASTPLKLPLMDRTMLFDDSTAGVMRMNAARLEALGQPPPPEMAKLARSLPPAEIQPIVVTDSILAAAFGRSRVIVDLPANPSAEWREAAAKLPLDLIARRIGTGDAVTIRRPDGSTVTPASPSELATAVVAARP